MAKWIILTGSGRAIRGRYEGTRTQVEKYCRDHYTPGGYRIIKDTGRKLEQGGKG